MGNEKMKYYTHFKKFLKICYFIELSSRSLMFFDFYSQQWIGMKYWMVSIFYPRIEVSENLLASIPELKTPHPLFKNPELKVIYQAPPLTNEIILLTSFLTSLFMDMATNFCPWKFRKNTGDRFRSYRTELVHLLH